MNTILCNQGYIVTKKSITDNQIKSIKKDLKVKPFIQGSRGRFAKSFKIYLENNDKFCIPKFYGITHFGKPKLQDFLKGIDINLSFAGSLRDYQLDVIKTVVPKIKNQEGGTISLPPGRGKTVIACKLISELRKKTLVVVHKTFLLNQWKNRIEQFLPDARVGIVQGKVIDVDNKDIVIGMLQSLSLKDDYPDDLFDDIGTIIFDECHHLSAEKFSQILRRISVPYMIGLSGTPFRNDKLEKVFEYYIGKMLYYEKPKINQEILVNIYRFKMKHDKFKVVFNKYTKEAQISTMVSNMVELVERNTFIVNLIKECREDINRKILVLSDRLDHLDYIMEEVDKLDIGTTGKYVGGMKQSKLDESEEADIIFSTYSMSSEALDISSLNTVILGTSRRNVEQSVGRILRKQKGNYLSQPLVVDVVDDIRTFVNQSYTRKAYYKKITDFENIKTFTYNDGKVTLDEVKKIKQPVSKFADSDSDSDRESE
jgi:superfamily II DNA or RNA helicase